MKIDRIKSYRDVWEQNLCSVPSGFDIHHIDGDNKNNAIENLLMLPHSLHNKYHEIKNSINGNVINCDIKSVNELGSGYSEFLFSQHKKLINVLIECNKWADYKEYLLGNIPNINGIIL